MSHKKSTVCVACVIFPENWDYFDAFINSLSAQTYKDFELIIVNDGCDENELKQVLTQRNIQHKIWHTAYTTFRKQYIEYIEYLVQRIIEYIEYLVQRISLHNISGIASLKQ